MAGSRRSSQVVAAALAVVACVTSVVAATAQRPTVDERLRTLFAQAEAFYRSDDPGRAYLPLSQVITVLEAAQEAGGFDQEARLLLLRCLAYRADVNLAEGERQAADEDLERFVALAPRQQIERFRVSDDLVDRFDGVRERNVAYLEFAVAPMEASVLVDGDAVPSGVTVYPVLAGTHIVEARLPGYTTAREVVELRAGNREELQLTLHRVSAVLRLLTRPPGATVIVDGEMVGTTAGVAPADFVPSGEAAEYPRRDFSDELVVENLLPGVHEIEIVLEGYRSRRYTVTLDSLSDWHAGGIVLTPSAGTLLLRELPHDATVWVDGRQVEARPPAAGGGAGVESAAYRVAVSPGPHRVTVGHPTAGVFEAEVSVAEQTSRTLSVRLNPGLTFLGTVGGDRLSADALAETLQESFRGLPFWTFLDRNEEGPAALRRSGVTAERLVATVAGQRAEGIDWERVQASLERELPGSLFVLGALPEGGLSTEADVWVWPAAPGPARPEHLRLSLGNRNALERLGRRLSERVSFQRPALGMRLIDTEAESAPVVAAVMPGGPAASAGIQAGDLLVSVGGNVVGTTANARAWFATYEPGAAVAVGIDGPAGERTVDLRMEISPEVVAPADFARLYSVVWAQAAAAAGRLDGPLAAWVAALNQASVFLRAGEWVAATELLERVQAPTGPGVGQAMVDYWLGLAYSRSGDEERARAAFERAAASPDGRLYHDDGPLVAPRARVRLAALASAR